MLKYVLASVRRLEDTRQIITLRDADEVNDYLRLGWKLIDKHVTVAGPDAVRNEAMQFVLAWQSDEPPHHPGSAPPANRELDRTLEIDEEI
jgi:hypothetical protein